MKYKYLGIVTACLIMFSCSDNKNYKISTIDGIEVIKNKNVYAKSNFTYKLNMQGTIASDSLNDIKTVTDLKEDQDGNIYIVDMLNYRISKYSPDLKYVNSIGSRGKGPGEYLIIKSCFIAKDTLFIPETNILKLIKYHTAGVYLYEKTYETAEQVPSFINNLGNKYIGIITESSANPETQSSISHGINLFDGQFNYKKALNSGSEISAFCTIKNRIYISNKSENEYSIEVYDENLTKVQTIKREYVSQKNSDHHKAVYDLKSDKNDYLWVKTPDTDTKNKSGYIYDIYKDGILISKCDILESAYQSIIYIGQKIYIYDEKERKIKIYEYKVISL